MKKLVLLAGMLGVIIGTVGCKQQVAGEQKQMQGQAQVASKLPAAVSHPSSLNWSTDVSIPPYLRNLVNNPVGFIVQTGIDGAPIDPLSLLSGDHGSIPTTQVPNLVPQVFYVRPGQVALTIDDGPSPYTEQMVQVLEKFHAKATFFLVGSRVVDYPGAMRAIIAAGDVVGDHTVDHKQLTKLSLAMQTREIEYAAKLIQQTYPYAINLFRPPYESYDENTEKVLQANHMALALWNRDPLDWAAKTPSQVVQHVLTDRPSGGVFDLHDTAQTLAALPAILEGLQKQHLQLVVLQAPTSSSGIAYSGSSSALTP